MHDNTLDRTPVLHRALHMTVTAQAHVNFFSQVRCAETEGQTMRRQCEYTGGSSPCCCPFPITMHACHSLCRRVGYDLTKDVYALHHQTAMQWVYLAYQVYQWDPWGYRVSGVYHGQWGLSWSVGSVGFIMFIRLIMSQPQHIAHYS